jgi:hypothetical protein
MVEAAFAIATEVVVVSDDQLFDANLIHQNLTDKLQGRRTGEFFGKGMNDQMVESGLLKQPNFFLQARQ